MATFLYHFLFFFYFVYIHFSVNQFDISGLSSVIPGFQIIALPEYLNNKESSRVKKKLAFASALPNFPLKLKNENSSSPTESASKCKAYGAYKE